MLNKRMLIILIMLFVGQFDAATNINFKTQFVANAQKAGFFTDKTFEGLIKGLKPLNNKIPKTNKKSLRVVTYNVHGFKNALNKKTGKSIYYVLKNINADVLVLQEVYDKDKIIWYLNKLGYKYRVFAPIDSSKHFGNMILSKYPFKKKQINYFKNNSLIKSKKLRSYIEVELDLSKFGKKNLVIYGTHLAIYSQVPKRSPKNSPHDENIRIGEIKELLWRIKNQDKNKNVIIAGDFNSAKTGTALTTLIKAGFKDNFSNAKVNVPVFTNLHGGAIDYIFSKFKDLKNVGSYIYFTAASDHLPVISDIK
ncbi:MAG: endonuclease/exonuclease/phosphatase family protein [Candidatus Babeliales bacterium]|nr:endonuclease/exonuclease/phosphatase family protein [Candidatus Babeliales bacterium]